MSTLETLIDIFKNIVPDCEYDMSQVQMDTKIVEDLGMNSIAIMYLVLAIEQEFDVVLHNTNIESFQTVGDVVTFVEENR